MPHVKIIGGAMMHGYGGVLMGPDTRIQLDGVKFQDVRHPVIMRDREKKDE
jgi:hypothetical protein